MLLRKDFSFDAAHNLVSYHGKCEWLHGHTYKLSVVLTGRPDSEGMILDFIELKRIVNEEIISQFDHAYLNDIISQPSAENLAEYVFKKLDPLLSGPNYSLHEIAVWESATSGAMFRREDLEQ